MKKIFITLFLSITCSILNAQHQTDSRFINTNKFMNPVFSGDYPDPSILVDGKDFYIVHSSFEYYPGLTIWHSKDLINWTPINSVLTKYVGSVYAPELIKYNSKYYIYFPANNTNFVIVADSVSGKWSDPIDLKVGNIDPGHVVDDKGNRYLYFSSGGYVPLSKDGLSVTADFQPSYEGWPIPRDWTIECFCMEGPKLFKRGQYYYMTVAEGGTAGPATGHMVISARSKSPLGPWENSPYNPILRAESNNEKWWSVGHATIFEASTDNWWMIFHGYENEYHNMGRQTMLVPVEWTNDGWYKLPDSLDLEKPINRPLEGSSISNYSLNDNFEGDQLKPQWSFFAEHDTSRYELTNNSIEIKAQGRSIGESSPLLCIPSDHSYMAQVEIEVKGDAIGGLVLYYNDKISSGIRADKRNIWTNLREWHFITEKEVIDSHVYLRLKNIENTVDMYYSTDEVNWIKIENSFEVSSYNHQVLSGFLSLRIGLVSMGEGKVIFKNFKYEPIK